MQVHCFVEVKDVMLSCTCAKYTICSIEDEVVNYDRFVELCTWYHRPSITGYAIVYVCTTSVQDTILTVGAIDK